MSSTKALSPRESAELISSKSEDVSICEEGIEEASKIIFDCLKSNKYSSKTWKQHELHPNEMTNETVDWIVVLDTLNFCFWSDDGVEPWTVRYEGKNYTGYWALCASIHRALKVCWNLYKVAHFRQHWATTKRTVLSVLETDRTHSTFVISVKSFLVCVVLLL